MSTSVNQAAVKGWFEPQRLAQARNARGLTQPALQALIGTSVSTISKWEKGHSQPDPEAILKLSKALSMPERWFAKPVKESDAVHLFRSNAAVTQSARRVAKTRLYWAHELCESLHEWIEPPALNIIEPLSREQALMLDDSSIERLANDLRKLWGLGTRPIKNLIALIEANGIVVVKEPFGYEGMDGVSTWYDRPFIWVSSDKENFFRSRFDVAHELGHILMHRNLLEKDCSGNRFKIIEDQAFRFAAYFLMPSDAISRSLRVVTLDSLVMEKRHWGVSVAALIMQYTQLGIINEEHKTRLFRNYSYRKWRMGEPFDDMIPPEKPMAMADMMETLLRDGGFKHDDLLEKTALLGEDLKSLCSLPDDFFSSETEKNALKRRSNLRVV